MTEQPNPNELLLITREELERCCSQMSAAGYKVSANYVEASVLSRSHPHTPAAPDNELEELGNQDIDPAIFEAYASACNKGAEEQYLKEHDTRSRPAPLTQNDGGDCLAICQHCGKVTQVQCKKDGD